MRPLPFTVGRVEFRDLPDLYRLPGIELLNQPDSLLTPFSPWRAALRSRLRWPRSRRRVLVARTNERVIGVALFQPLRPDQRWRLDAVGATAGIYDPHPVVQELIRQGITVAGLNGVKRLYARTPSGAFCRSALRVLGFAPYATETVLVASGLVPRRRPLSVRAQVPADTWAIHQLYSAIAPRQVQYAEALTSDRWEVTGTSASLPVQGLVIEEGHHIVAMARISSRNGSYRFEVLIHPERADVIEELLDGVAAYLAERPAGRVYAAVRGYQQEVVAGLVARGMTVLHEQELVVKYTTANVRLPAYEALPAASLVREGVPHRVPTFLQIQPDDETVT